MGSGLLREVSVWGVAYWRWCLYGEWPIGGGVLFVNRAYLGKLSVEQFCMCRGVFQHPGQQPVSHCLLTVKRGFKHFKQIKNLQSKTLCSVIRSVQVKVN